MFPVENAAPPQCCSALFSPQGALPAQTVYRLFTSEIFKAKHLLVTPQSFTPPKRGKTHLSLFPSCSNMINYSFIIN